MIVKMKPMCDCGYVFDELTAERGYAVDSDGWVHHANELLISPGVCPKCKARIEAIQSQIPIDERLHYDVKKYYNLWYDKADTVIPEVSSPKLEELYTISFDISGGIDVATATVIKICGVNYNVVNTFTGEDALWMYRKINKIEV